MTNKCEIINTEKDLETILITRDKLFVLFYASWCPYSQDFLPKFMDKADSSDHCYMRVIVDDKDDLVDKYGIEVYPTVLFFEKGKVSKRLDGVPHQGLNAPKLDGFVKKCSA